MKNGGKTNTSGITWDFREIFSIVLNGSWEHILEQADGRASSLVSLYRGRLSKSGLDPGLLAEALKEYESILQICMETYQAAFLYRSSKIMDNERNKILANIKEKVQSIRGTLVPLELELRAMPEKKLEELSKHEELYKYRYHILRQIQYKTYTLSESEERLLWLLSNTFKTSLLTLFDETIGDIFFEVRVKGKIIQISADRAIQLLQSAERDTREIVFKRFMEELSVRGVIFKNILNSLMKVYKLEDSLRGHLSPLDRVNTRNDLEGRISENIMSAVEIHYPLVHRYYSIKSRLMGQDKVEIFDINAPIAEEALILDFSQAKEIILNALKGFHPLFAEVGESIFKCGLVDAEVRDDKQGGAFCKCLTPTMRPYISIKYGGTARALMELAHEIGHGIHNELSAGNSYLNFKPVPVLAETASIFIEIIVSNYMLKSDRFRESCHLLLPSFIEGSITAVFRQNVITLFEKAVYEMRRGHVMDKDEICDIWLRENAKLYGDKVNLPPIFRWGWAYIPHIFHNRFYCYSYILGSTVSVLLYEKFEGGSECADEIVSFFGRGKTESPKRLLKDLGINLDKEKFWLPFFGYLESLIDLFEVQWICRHEELQSSDPPLRNDS